MPAANDRHEFSFIVRVWSDGVGGWRASLEDVETQERVYVLGLREIGDILALRCTPAGTGPDL